jgi:aldehyde:ferredoxin oxidoreductase
VLVDRYHDEPARRGAPDVVGAVIDRKKFKTMRAEFYQHQGWDEAGIPTPETLKLLGLESLDKEPSRI